MSGKLIERLRGHVADLAAERAECVDDVGGFPAPDQLETDLSAAIQALDDVSALNDELYRANRLLHQAVDELNRYREWAKQVRYVAGSGPGGAL